MRGIDDDEVSYRSGSLSRNSSTKSFTGNFNVDWDEIDSIAEESLSVASSASSGHRKRTRRRTHQPASTISQFEALESGSLSRYITNTSGTSSSSMSGSHGSRGSGSGGKRSKTPPRPSQPRQPMTQQQRNQRRRMVQHVKRLINIGGLVMAAILSIHFCGSYLSAIVTYPSSFGGLGGGDRSARRALSRSAALYATRKWPLSVREEQADFEFVPHPANDKIKLAVPRFYLTRDDGTLETLGRVKSFSRDMASMVGKSTVDGSTDFSVRTIFVGIPSFRDWHCRSTIESLFQHAKYPERIRVGVVDQLEDQDQSCDLPIHPCSEKPRQALCQYRQQIDVYEMDHKLAVGPTFARHIVNRLYRGEFYALQISAHTKFARNWDVDLINQLEETGNEMGILTTYLDDAMGNIDEKTGSPLKESRLVLCSASFEGAGHNRRLRHNYDQQPDTLPVITEMPQLQPFWSASFSFARGHFILTVPYDPSLPMVNREDEEIIMTLRAFTQGYDFYTPIKNVCFDSARSDNLQSFQELQRLYKGVEKVSLRRLDGIAGMDDENYVKDPNEIFGLGQARPLGKFHTAFGVHPSEHITEHKLCNFVSTGRMHKLFQPHLREDGMGINYDVIHFRFHELQNDHDA